MRSLPFASLLVLVAVLSVGAGWVASGMLFGNPLASQEQPPVSPESIENSVFMDFFASNAEGTVVEKTEDSFTIERQGKRLSLVVQEQAGISTFFQENKDGSSVAKKFEDIKVGDRVRGGVSISKPNSLFLVGSSSEGFRITAHRFVILSQGALQWPALRLLGDFLFPKTDAHQIVSGFCYHPFGNWVSCGGANYCSGGTWKNDVTYCTYYGASGYPSGNANHYSCYTNYGVPHGGSCGAAPTVSLTADPNPTSYNGSTTLEWRSTDATSCTATAGQGFSGSKATNGSQAVSNLTASQLFAIQCFGFGGLTAVSSVYVTVNSPSPPPPPPPPPPQTCPEGYLGTPPNCFPRPTSCFVNQTCVSANSMKYTAVLNGVVTTYNTTCPSGTVCEAATPPNWSWCSYASCFTPCRYGDCNGGVTKCSGTSIQYCQASLSDTLDGRLHGCWSGPIDCNVDEEGNTGGNLVCSNGQCVAPPPPPTVTISASPNPTAYNGSTTLSWSSTNATSCTAYAGQGFSGSKSTNGSQVVPNLVTSQSFLILCSGAGGSAWGFTFVTVLPPSPTVTISASPNPTSYNGSTTLSWSSTNATSCTAYAGQGFSGPKATSGSQTVPNLTASQSFLILCSGAGGSAWGLTFVTVLPPSQPPTASISANPTSIQQGNSSNLVWSSTNATLCTASGAWSGSKATSGSQSTGALYSAQTYYLQCSGAGGTSNPASATVTVSPPPPPPNPPPSASPSAPTTGDYCGASSPPIFLAWQFIDPGDTQSAYRVQVDNNPGFSSPEADSGQVSSSSTQYSPPGLPYNISFNWRVMVWDSQGSNSSWTNGSDFTTASHQYPTSNFSWSPTNPGELQTAQFTDTSQVYGGATKSAWGWTFQQGSPATSTQQNPQAQFTPVGIKQVALQITDSSGYSCQISKNVNVQVPFPDWQEISPF